MPQPSLASAPMLRDFRAVVARALVPAEAAGVARARNAAAPAAPAAAVFEAGPRSPRSPEPGPHSAFRPVPLDPPPVPGRPGSPASVIPQPATLSLDEWAVANNHDTILAAIEPIVTMRVMGMVQELSGALGTEAGRTALSAAYEAKTGAPLDVDGTRTFLQTKAQQLLASVGGAPLAADQLGAAKAAAVAAARAVFAAHPGEASEGNFMMEAFALMMRMGQGAAPQEMVDAMRDLAALARDALDRKDPGLLSQGERLFARGDAMEEGFKNLLLGGAESYDAALELITLIGLLKMYWFARPLPEG